MAISSTDMDVDNAEQETRSRWMLLRIPKVKTSFVLRLVGEWSPGLPGLRGSGFPMKPCVKCHDSLEQMKLHARPQSCDEPYRQDH